MAFAETDDVAVRLGRALTDPEAELVDQVLELVEGEIINAVGKSQEWADELDPTPAAFRALSIQKAIDVGTNPHGLAARSKTLGSFQSSETFRRSSDAGALLTVEEAARCRDAIYLAAGDSARVTSIIDDVLDFQDDGIVNESI